MPCTAPYGGFGRHSGPNRETGPVCGYCESKKFSWPQQSVQLSRSSDDNRLRTTVMIYWKDCPKALCFSYHCGFHMVNDFICFFDVFLVHSSKAAEIVYFANFSLTPKGSTLLVSFTGEIQHYSCMLNENRLVFGDLFHLFWLNQFGIEQLPVRIPNFSGSLTEDWSHCKWHTFFHINVLDKIDRRARPNFDFRRTSRSFSENPDRNQQNEPSTTSNGSPVAEKSILRFLHSQRNWKMQTELERPATERLCNRRNGLREAESTCMLLHMFSPFDCVRRTPVSNDSGPPWAIERPSSFVNRLIDVSFAQVKPLLFGSKLAVVLTHFIPPSEQKERYSMSFFWQNFVQSHQHSLGLRQLRCNCLGACDRERWEVNCISFTQSSEVRTWHTSRTLESRIPKLLKK